MTVEGTHRLRSHSNALILESVNPYDSAAKGNRWGWQAALRLGLDYQKMLHIINAAT